MAALHFVDGKIRIPPFAVANVQIKGDHAGILTPDVIKQPLDKGGLPLLRRAKIM